MTDEQLQELDDLLSWPQPIRRDLDRAQEAIRELMRLRSASAAVADDVRLYGVGITVHTPDGVKRVPPQDVIFRRSPDS